MLNGHDLNKGYYHICTDGNAIPWMFQDDEDFIAGINRIALCILKNYVEIIAFILMDNHVHFVLYGTALQCKKFINSYKMLTGKWIHNKYGLKDYLRLLPTEMISISDEETLLNTLAYIDRNSIVAGYRYMPSEYPWGSARYMFRDKEHEYQHESDFKPLAQLPLSKQRSLLKTRAKVPGEWYVDSRGMISPSLFMDFSRIEHIFRTPTRYSYFLAKKLEGQVEMQLSKSRKVFIPDKELRQIVRKIAHDTYRTEDVRTLDVNSRLAIARRLRYDYASTLKQISRMVCLTDDLLKGFV